MKEKAGELRGSITERFFDPKAINESFRNFGEKLMRQGLSSTTSPSPNDFIYNFPQFQKLQFKAIKERQFELQAAKAATVFADKARLVHLFPIPDRFILFHFARCISKEVEPSLPDTLYSFRPGRGNSDALNRTLRFIKTRPSPLFILRRDIKDFGSSLPHQIILEIGASRLQLSPELMNLLEQACRFRTETEGRLVENSIGLPTGSFLQLVFENLILLDLDRALNCSPEVLSLRYGDDILHMSLSADASAKAHALLANAVSENQLLFNEKKSLDIILCPSHAVPELRTQYPDILVVSEFEYLGLILTAQGRSRLPRRKLRSLLKELAQRLHTTARAHQTQQINGDKAEYLIRSVDSFFSRGESLGRSDKALSYLSLISDETQLREIDSWIVMKILTECSPRSGWNKSLLRGRARKKLREAGLSSLLHLRRYGEL